MFIGSIVYFFLIFIIIMEIFIFSFLFVIYIFVIYRYLFFVLWFIVVSEGRWGAFEVGVYLRVCFDILKVIVLLSFICVFRVWVEYFWGWGRVIEVR